VKALVAALLLIAGLTLALAQRVAGGPKPGEDAIDFSLKIVGEDKRFTLKDNFGKRPTILIFGSYT
jgi:hypothetical protein